ncbi:MAG TPA: response regulator, partial [Chloroflexota bacterium]
AQDLRSLAREFNRMAETLEAKDAQLLRRNEELEEQYRRLQEASRLKGEFLANMSHELRTPLNGIIGFAELMHDEKVGPISADHKEYLGDILTSGRHLLQLINDVLDLSKVESGKMDFYPEPVEMSRVVTEVRDVLRTLAAEKLIRIEVEVDPQVDAIVADPARLKQILFNYLSNAIKFTPNEGQITVRVTPEGADSYRLAVQDTGIGIPADEVHRLFVEFQQLDSSVSKQYQGTGLGLALTKRLVEAQGGSVGVESTPGRGSTFYAVLPLVMRAMEDVGDPRPPIPTYDGHGPSVLVIDDNATDCEWLSRVLGGAGYHISLAGSGAEALRLCRERVFDAITLDLMLPDLPGARVLEEIRSGTPNADTPVVIVSVLAQADVGIGFAIQDYLLKPVRAPDLLAALFRAGVEPSDRSGILVVDDDATVRNLLEAALRGAGYQPICVADGRRGLELVKRKDIAAVVLDLLMPEMDGFEFLHRLRRLPEGRRIPVVVLTAKDLTPQDRRHLENSTQAVVSKSEGGTTALLAELEACVPRPQLATASGPTDPSHLRLADARAER